MTTRLDSNHVELIDGYSRKSKPVKRVFRVLTLDEIRAWSVPQAEPCTFCDHGILKLSFNDTDHVARYNASHNTNHTLGETINIACGACNGTMTRFVDRTPSHIWFVSLDGTARQAKVNGKVRTWKRDLKRVELPVKYGMYEYSTFDANDIANGRIIEPVQESASCQ